MVFVDGENIAIPKGDSGSVTFTFKDGSKAGETVWLCIAEHIWSKPIIQKSAKIVSGGGGSLKATFTISGEESNIRSGRYWYSLMVDREAGFDTPIVGGLFSVERVIRPDEC